MLGYGRAVIESFINSLIGLSNSPLWQGLILACPSLVGNKNLFCKADNSITFLISCLARSQETDDIFSRYHYQLFFCDDRSVGAFRFLISKIWFGNWMVPALLSSLYSFVSKLLFLLWFLIAVAYAEPA